MVRTRFALILYFRLVARKAACLTLEGFLEINEGVDSEVEDLFCGAPSSSEPSLFFSNYLISLGF